MTFRTLSRVWTGVSMAILAGLWIALLWAPDLLGPLGRTFLATPIVMAAFTVWKHSERDRLTMLCLAALLLLFLFSWFV